MAIALPAPLLAACSSSFALSFAVDALDALLSWGLPSEVQGVQHVNGIVK